MNRQKLSPIIFSLASARDLILTFLDLFSFAKASQRIRRSAKPEHINPERSFLSLIT